MMISTIPVKLRKLRNKAGKTQAQTAALLYISRQTYSTYECGRTIPNLEMLTQISQLYGIKLSEFLEL